MFSAVPHWPVLGVPQGFKYMVMNWDRRGVEIRMRNTWLSFGVFSTAAIAPMQKN